MFESWIKNLPLIGGYAKGKITRRRQGFALIVVGSLLLGISLFLKGYLGYRQNILSFSQAPEIVGKIKDEELPVKVIIPKLGKELTITPARVINDQWEIAEDGASYLLGSGIPGKEGNVVIYGHNKKHLFGPIRWLEKEELIKITTLQGEEFTYKITETKTVSPDEVEVLAPTKEAILTLYTCTGFLDRERFVIVAQLQSD